MTRHVHLTKPKRPLHRRITQHRVLFLAQASRYAFSPSFSSSFFPFFPPPFVLLSLIINHCSTDSNNLQKKTELGATVTFLLRTPSIFDTNSAIQKYVSSGTARLIKGDALVREDVEQAWKEAAGKENKPVDVLLFTVGTFSPPQFHCPTKLSKTPGSFHFTKVAHPNSHY